MANPTQAARTAIAAQVNDWGLSDAALVASLNAALVNNPVSVAPQIPKPVTTESLMGLVGKTSRKALMARPALVQFALDARNQDRQALINWIVMAYDADDITLSERNAIVAELQATIPDAAWAAQLPWPVVALGRLVDLEDIAATRTEVQGG